MYSTGNGADQGTQPLRISKHVRGFERYSCPSLRGRHYLVSCGRQGHSSVAIPYAFESAALRVSFVFDLHGSLLLNHGSPPSSVASASDGALASLSLSGEAGAISLGTHQAVVEGRRSPGMRRAQGRASLDNAARAPIGCNMRRPQQGDMVLVAMEAETTVVASRLRSGIDNKRYVRGNRYLTVLVTLPESLLEELERDGDEVQLCLQGCHEQERLDRPGAAPLSMAAMSKSKAKELCKGYNVTDYYLDSCIFDLMATGDTSFCKAAQTAQKDLWEHDPIGAQRLLLNCSDPPCMWSPSFLLLDTPPPLLFSRVTPSLLIILLLLSALPSVCKLSLGGSSDLSTTLSSR
ncbi:putative RGM domain family member B-like isoform X1 [Penaeus vannamei]|uniref:Putative RGM domain family member B-like isoform X1 n=1 Tax=Penaeus vannamei TaxID=6689 RepID=A0A3R7QHR8_PENVA|nr:putative RGM domain family member B-like isoform X1 [Penaeus vannamei]